jgi:hypothetical protein
MIKIKFFSLPKVVHDAKSTNNRSSKRNPLFLHKSIIGLTAVGAPHPHPVEPNPFAIFSPPLIIIFVFYMANPPRRKPGKIPGTRKTINIRIQIQLNPPNKPPAPVHPLNPSCGSTNIKSNIIQIHALLNPKRPPTGAGDAPHPAAVTGLATPNPLATVQTPSRIIIGCSPFHLYTMYT